MGAALCNQKYYGCKGRPFASLTLSVAATTKLIRQIWIIPTDRIRAMEINAGCTVHQTVSSPIIYACNSQCKWMYVHNDNTTHSSNMKLKWSVAKFGPVPLHWEEIFVCCCRNRQKCVHLENGVLSRGLLKCRITIEQRFLWTFTQTHRLTPLVCNTVYAECVFFVVRTSNNIICINNKKSCFLSFWFSSSDFVSFNSRMRNAVNLCMKYTHNIHMQHLSYMYINDNNTLRLATRQRETEKQRKENNNETISSNTHTHTVIHAWPT